MRKLSIILFFIFITSIGYCQHIDSSFAGRYSDGYGDITMTELTLRKNGTFKLKTPDPIFTYTFNSFDNEGNWISRKDTVILNPNLLPRITKTNLSEKTINLKDSILIKVRYIVENYSSDTLKSKEDFKFNMLTVCLNKKSKYFNLVSSRHYKTCAFAHKVKNQLIVDSTNTFKIKRKNLNKIGVNTYGFEDIVWLNVSDLNSNYFEIEIIQQIDNERTPRNRELIVEGNKVYFYKRKGKIDKFLFPLIKKF